MEIPMVEPEFEKPRIPEEMYEAVLKEVKAVSDGTYGPRVAWVFTILPQKKVEEAVELAMLTYVNATKGSKCTKVYEALGGKFEEGKTIQTELLIGKMARVMVEDYEKDDEKFSTITKVKPLQEEETEEDETVEGQ